MKEEEEEMEAGAPTQPTFWVIAVCLWSQAVKSEPRRESLDILYLLKDGGTGFHLCSPVTLFIFHLISHQNRHLRREMDVTSGSECSRSIVAWRKCSRGVCPFIPLGAAVEQH